MMALNEERTTGNSSGWNYWLEKLRQIFPSGSSDPRGYDFAVAIRDRFRNVYTLEDDAIGVWYAALQALQPLNESHSEVEARFILSSYKTSPKTDVFTEPVHVPISVHRDFNEPSPPSAPRLFYFFTFIDLLPIDQNIKLFEESAIARVVNFEKHPPKSTLENELAAHSEG